MNLAQQLAKDAKTKGICDSWHKKLKSLDNNKRAMLMMYLRGIDFCISNDFPTNDFIRDNFKGEMEDYGIFLDDDNIQVVNYKKIVALGSCKGEIEVTGYTTSEIIVKHQSDVKIIAGEHAFIVVDLFDDAKIEVTASDKAKVKINRYGGRVIIPSGSNDYEMIRVTETHKKTY